MSTATRRLSLGATILIAGLVAAAVEMVPVLPIQNALGASPVLVFQSIASGWQGRAAFAGGMTSVCFGVAIHVFVSLVAAALFVLASRRLGILIRHYILAGIAFGFACWAVMTYLVIPLSAIGSQPAPALRLVAASIAVHLFFFGLPIAAVTRFAGEPS
jgi:hypothetical protein